jgi:uncharacterized protein (TIGR02145 family)
MKKEFVILILLILLACKRDDQVPVTLAVEFSLTRPSTIESVLCKARLEGPKNLDTTGYLYRWDWESDQTWDTRYSAVPYIRKSFEVPGEYQVTVESVSDKGEVSTTSGVIKVVQGFSAPKADFKVLPDSGNFKTLFVFDAGSTVDAQENSSLLTYRWDFNNDQDFELTLKGNPIAEYRFPNAGIFKVNLLVVDTSGLWGRFQKEVKVNLLDTTLHIVLNIDPEYPSDLDTIHIFAGNSYHAQNPATPLTFSWRRFGSSWTEPSGNPDYYLKIQTIGTHKVSVRIYSPDGLYNEKEIELVVSRANKPPTARVTRNMRFGNILSVFEFDAWSSSDPDNVPSELMARWDFDGDGNWDTSFDYPKIVKRVYQIPGVYSVGVEVMDPDGLKGKASIDIHVSANTHPTSQIKDVRDDQVYGIVQIGNQWWMGENLNWAPFRDSMGTWMCFDYKPSICEVTGKLYHAQSIGTYYTGETEARNLCPRGWHVPSVSEWQVLLQELGWETAGSALAYGGSSDMNVLLGGKAAYYSYGTFEEFEMDSIYKVAYLMSSDIGMSVSALQLKRNDTKVQFRNMPAKGFYSVRCVKNN